MLLSQGSCTVLKALNFKIGIQDLENILKLSKICIKY